MFVSVYHHTFIFFLSVFWGLAIGFFYDILRNIRYEAKSSFVLTSIMDSFFWVIVCVWFFIFAITDAGGQIRGYLFFGVILGGFLYFLAISPLIFTGIRSVIKLLIKVFSSLFTLFSKILKKTLSFFFKKG